jgi:hypothetical protein
MTARVSALIVALVAVATIAAVPMAGVATQAEGPATDAPTENATTADVSNASATPPGAQLAGVVGVGQAEIDAEVDDRAFGIRVAQAASNASRADVVSDRLGEVEERVAELERERDALQQARENGSMSEGEYRARTATLAARTRSAERAANQSADVAQGLPAALLESTGINATAIRTLAERANELNGPEVAEIARSIAGEGVGRPAAGDRTPFGEDGPVPEDAAPDDAGPNAGGSGDAGPGAGDDDRADGNETDGADGTDGPGNSPNDAGEGAGAAGDGGP